MKNLKAIIVLAVFSGCMLTIASAKPEYAKKEGKKCAFCHVKTNANDLTDAGKYYKAHDHSLEGYKAPAKGKKA